MARLIQLERAFILVLRGQARAATLAVIRELAWLSRQQLPAPTDYEALVHPLGVAWVRKVPLQRLWIFYSFDQDVLHARWLRTTEPLPAVPA